MTVVSLGDGDTLRVRNQQGEPITIRFGCMDAPELKQTPWGQHSRTRLGQLLPVGQSVQGWQIERDKYKRLVAEGKKNTQPTTERSPQVQQCDSSYPDFCIPPNSPDLDYPDIPYRRFRVNQTDPHGIGCER